MQGSEQAADGHCEQVAMRGMDEGPTGVLRPGATGRALTWPATVVMGRAANMLLGGCSRRRQRVHGAKISAIPGGKCCLWQRCLRWASRRV